jgi:hypothetical protein
METAIFVILIGIAMILFWRLGSSLKANTGQIHSADISHAIRRRQRPKF